MSEAHRPLVIQTEDLDLQAAQWLGERAELLHAPHTSPEFAERLPHAEGMVVRTYTPVDAAMLDAAPKLRVVGRAGVALENVDVAACLARDVQVVHTPGSNTRAVVEYFTALLLDAERPRMYLTEALEGERWHETRRTVVAKRELCEQTLGVWGFGRIGSAVARVGSALDMRVLYHDIRTDIDPALAAASGAQPVDLDTLLAESDVLTIHIDYREDNRHALNAETLKRVKPDARIINTSRGFVVDHHALRDFLGANIDALAVLDVHDPHEPIPADHPLLGVPNAWLSPHLASGTIKAKRDMSWVVRDVWRVLRGESPEHPPPPWLLEAARAKVAAAR